MLVQNININYNNIIKLRIEILFKNTLFFTILKILWPFVDVDISKK